MGYPFNCTTRYFSNIWFYYYIAPAFGSQCIFILGCTPLKTLTLRRGTEIRFLRRFLREFAIAANHPSKKNSGLFLLLLNPNFFLVPPCTLWWVWLDEKWIERKKNACGGPRPTIMRSFFFSAQHFSLLLFEYLTWFIRALMGSSTHEIATKMASLK